MWAWRTVRTSAGVMAGALAEVAAHIREDIGCLLVVQSHWRHDKRLRRGFVRKEAVQAPAAETIERELAAQ